MPLTETFNQDSSGNATVVGTGIAGTPSGGVVTMQGDPAMTPVKSIGTGAAGTPAAGVMTVQGTTGMTPVSVLSDVSSTATLTSVTASATSVSLLAANPNRKGFILYNTSGHTCDVAFAATAAATAFTLAIPANSLFESQFLYTGVVSGIWVGGTGGSMQVTELT